MSSFDVITYGLLKDQVKSLQDDVEILNGDETVDGSVENKIAEALADTPEEYAKLQQLQQWLDDHSDMEAALISDVDDLKQNKQDKLTEGEFITIDGNNVIDVKVDTEIDSTSNNPISNAAVADIAATLETVSQTASQASETASNASQLAASANSTANEAKSAVNNKQDKLIPGANITIQNNVISAKSEGNLKGKEITQAEYDLLPPAVQKNGDVYFIKDAKADPYEAGQGINITDNIISVAADAELQSNSTNAVQNKPVAEAVANLSQRDTELSNAIGGIGDTVAAIESTIGDIQTTLADKQDKLRGSDDITIQNNIVDLSESFETGLNNRFNSLEEADRSINSELASINNEIDTIDLGITNILDDINSLDQQERSDVRAINGTLTEMSTAIMDLGTGKQNKLTAGTNVTIDEATNTISVPNVHTYAAGDGIKFTEGNPTTISTKFNIEYHSSDAQHIGYVKDLNNNSDVYPYTIATAVGYNTTSNVAEALNGNATNIDNLNTVTSAHTGMIQNMQTTVAAMNNTVNSLQNAFSGLSSVYLPKQNPQYNGTFSSTGNYALGSKSIVLGNNSTATGVGSFVCGDNLYAGEDYQTVLGKYNEPSTVALIIGNGEDGEEKANALTVDWDGTTIIKDNEGSKTTIKNDSITVAYEDEDFPEMQERIEIDCSSIKYIANDDSDYLYFNQRNTKTKVLNNIEVPANGLVSTSVSFGSAEMFNHIPIATITCSDPYCIASIPSIVKEYGNSKININIYNTSSNATTATLYCIAVPSTQTYDN